MKEITWRHKPRNRWIKKGDRTTKYFHCMTSHYKRNSYMESMEIGNIAVVWNEQLKRDVRDYWMKLVDSS